MSAEKAREAKGRLQAAIKRRGDRIEAIERERQASREAQEAAVYNLDQFDSEAAISLDDDLVAERIKLEKANALDREAIARADKLIAGDEAARAKQEVEASAARLTEQARAEFVPAARVMAKTTRELVLAGREHQSRYQQMERRWTGTGRRGSDLYGIPQDGATAAGIDSKLWAELAEWADKLNVLVALHDHHKTTEKGESHDHV